VVAINQLGIATTLINTLMIGLVGAFTLAFGLAFGLGGRDRAAQILDTVGRSSERAGPKLQRAATAAQSTLSKVKSQPAQSTAQPTPGIGHHSQRAVGDGWVERSDDDRRRVERPGMRDRRTENGSER
jgi:hypothetical protein